MPNANVTRDYTCDVCMHQRKYLAFNTYCTHIHTHDTHTHTNAKYECKKVKSDPAAHVESYSCVVCTHTHTYTHIHTHTHTYTHVHNTHRSIDHTNTNTLIHIHTHTYAHTHTQAMAERQK